MSKISYAPYGYGSRLVTLHTPKLECTFSTLGAACVSVKVLSQKNGGRWIEVNCQYGNSYETALGDTGNYMGSTVGRFAGRLANGRFKLPGSDEVHHIARNMGEHVCHGGPNAFNKKEWGVQDLCDDDRAAVCFYYVSPHKENGFPGEMLCKVIYEINAKEPNVLNMYYYGEITDGSPAPASTMNMFNHNYWNINGVYPSPTGTKQEKIYNLIVHMPKCTKVAEGDRASIPTGKFLDVKSTPALDFTKPKLLGKDINDPALNRDPCGFDHPYLVEGYVEAIEKGKDHYPNKNFPIPRKVQHNINAFSPSSHIGVNVYSSYPCFWLYTSNNNPANPRSVHNTWTMHDCIGMEPQHFPDAINHPSLFASATVVERGKPFREVIRNEFYEGDTISAKL